MFVFVAVGLLVAYRTGRSVFAINALFIGCAVWIIGFFSGGETVRNIAKAEIISDMLAHHGWDHAPKFKKSTDFYNLDKHDVFPKWNGKRYGDKISGVIGGVPFTALEIHLKHGGGDGEVNHDLLMIKVPSAESFKGVTLVRTKSALLDLNQRYVRAPLKRIKFVSSQFEKLFNVYSTDGVEAQFLLPPDFIEHVTAFTYDLEGKTSDDFQIALGDMAEEISQILTSHALRQTGVSLQSMTFMDNHFYIVLGSSDFFEFKRTSLTLSDPIHVDTILTEIDLIYQIFDHFKKRMKRAV